MSPSKDGNPAPPKIAIKGFSLSTKSNGTKPGPKTTAKPSPGSTLGKRPRSGFGHESDSDEHDDSRTSRGRHEVVTGFGADGAIKREETKVAGPLVIPKMANKDWRGEARAKHGGIKARGKNLLPPEVQAAREAAAREAREGVKQEGVDVVNSNDGEIQWGLSVRKRVKVEEHAAVDGEGEVADIQVDVEEEELVKPQSADDEALQALLGNKTEKKGPDMVIHAARSPSPSAAPISEVDAYKRAIASAPDVSTLEDYERVPVEEFGAALLRGMGWKGEKRGQVREVKRRQNLLGLGAKELTDAEELGAWVQKSDVKRLNERSGKGGGRERRPKASEYRREKEQRDERREERGGGSYRREKERERERDGRRDRSRDRGDYYERRR